MIRNKIDYVIKRIKSYLPYQVKEYYINFCIKKMIPLDTEYYAREARVEARSIVLESLWKTGLKFEQTFCDSFNITKKLPYAEIVYCIITLNIKAGFLTNEEINKITQTINDIRIKLAEKGFDILEFSIDAYPKSCSKYKMILR